MGSDLWLVFRFWAILFVIGTVAFPIAKRLFSSWWDHGYAFSKSIGIGLLTYLTYLTGTLHILPFTSTTIITLLVCMGLVSFIWMISISYRNGELRLKTRNLHWNLTKNEIVILVIEETFFFIALLLWSWVKGHEPAIRHLEKFMDFGFTRTILNIEYFPAPDMWFAGYPVNYYYFGHIVMALLTKLSQIDLAYTFNLMLAAIFALTSTMSFSIGYQLIHQTINKLPRPHIVRHFALIGGVLTSFLVTLSGNMQTIYAFTKGYTGEDVQPFWKLAWSLREFFPRLGEGLETYWYANATRFIPFTIHEFPSYSFAVSDMHGHVLAIPFALLALALIIQLFSQWNLYSTLEQYSRTVLYGILTGLLLMTNALDGPIYLLLFLGFLLIGGFRSYFKNQSIVKWFLLGFTVICALFVISLPLLFHFKSFVSGLAVNCPPAGLAETRIGPLLFEGVDKCQISPFWMWWLLWGFFIYCGVCFFVRTYLYTQDRNSGIWDRFQNTIKNFAPHEIVLLVFFVFSVALIIFPEFFYFKDIYPAHFRSNTMFKLGYQAFIMFSIVSGYTIVRLLIDLILLHSQRIHTKQANNSYSSKVQNQNLQNNHTKAIHWVCLLLLVPQLFLVSIYPFFSVRSYFGGLSVYHGLYGLNWMINEYPDNYKALEWLANFAQTSRLNKSTLVHESDCSGKVSVGNYFTLPVIVEADGDSYTDYNQISAFAGLPTVTGWAVHEWLWRGCYEVVSPRRDEIRVIYESGNVDETRSILDRYAIEYIFIGKLEREKFTNLRIDTLENLGSVVFRSGDTQIIQVKR